jgi:putative transposase
VRFGFIETEKACYPVALLCRVLDVSRAGFYAWRKRAASPRAVENQRLTLEVSAIYAASRRRYTAARGSTWSCASAVGASGASGSRG